MAQRITGISIVTAIVAAMMFEHHASAQTAGCTAAIVSLAPCLGYIMGNSSTPSSSCCSQLSSVVQTQAQCLCSLLNGGGSSFGININQTQALTLPSACKIQTPPASQCKAGPASSPTGAPAIPAAPVTPTTPSIPSVPSGTGSMTTPSTTGESSDGSPFKSAYSMIFSSLFVAASVSSLAVF